MASLWFNRGLKILVENTFFPPVAPVVNIYAALVTNDIVPMKSHTLLSQLQELPAANGYLAGGKPLTKGSTDFPVVVEDATGFVDVSIKNLDWTAAGGGIPHTGHGARYLVLTAATATSTVATRELICAIDLDAPRSISGLPVSEVLTIHDAKIRLSQPLVADPHANLFTTRGLRVMLDNLFRLAPSTTYWAALIDHVSSAPVITTTTLSTLTQCPIGNGYTDGGQTISVAAGATDFLNLTESALTNRVTFQTPVFTWTASGGQLPLAPSNGARWLALTGNDSSSGARDVIATACLKADRAKAPGEQLIIPSITFRLDN